VAMPFPLPGSKHSQMFSYLRNNWTWPKDLVTKDYYGSHGKIGAWQRSSNLVNERDVN
jgi:hypothetical protein